MSNLTAKDIETLGAPYDEKTIGVKIQAFNKERTKALLVLYLQHTDVYGRLDSVDPSWSSQVTNTMVIGNAVFVRVRLTVKGVSRENVGEGEDEKSALSDAIKRAAMLFGVGRYLYDTETVWVDYNDQTDRHRVFTYADHKIASQKRGIAPAPVAPTPPRAAAKPSSNSEPLKSREFYGQAITKTAKLLNMSEKDLLEWAEDLFNKKELKSLTAEEMAKFHDILQGELGAQGVLNVS